MYKWYDSLKEPKRFLVFFIPAAILIVGMNISSYPIINVISWTLVVAALATRMIYLYTGKRNG